MSLGLSQPKETLALQAIKAICTSIVLGVFVVAIWSLTLLGLPSLALGALIGIGISLALGIYVFLLASPLGKYLCLWPFYLLFPY